MRLPTNNIAIALVGFAVSLALIPIAILLIYLLRFAKALRRRSPDKGGRTNGAFSLLDAMSETRYL